MKRKSTSERLSQFFLTKQVIVNQSAYIQVRTAGKACLVSSRHLTLILVCERKTIKLKGSDVGNSRAQIHAFDPSFFDRINTWIAKSKSYQIEMRTLPLNIMRARKKLKTWILNVREKRWSSKLLKWKREVKFWMAEVCTRRKMLLHLVFHYSSSIPQRGHAGFLKIKPTFGQQLAQKNFLQIGHCQALGLRKLPSSLSQLAQKPLTIPNSPWFTNL